MLRLLSMKRIKWKHCRVSKGTRLINMNIGEVMLWGFGATVILTTIMVGSKYLGLTRIDLPFMLGTIFTESRDKAVRIGFVSHMIMGWIFAFIYGVAFNISELRTWWFGLAVGFVHAAFV